MKDKTPLARLVGEPEWETLQERRVYARIREEIDTKKKRYVPLRWVVLAGAAATVLIVATALVVMLVRSPETSRQPAAIAKKSDVKQPATSPLPHMSLNDGSRVYLSAGAKVHVEHQDKASIKLVQRRGKVRYEVKKNLPRSFEVKVDDVRVRVVGTVFTVSATGDAVEVKVLRGKVEVDRGGRTFSLGADEQLKLPRALRAEDGATKPSAKPPPRRGHAKKRLLPADLENLLKRVDAARRSGDLGKAASMLRHVLRTRKTGSRKAALLFTLGKVERERKRFLAAAKAFARCRAHAPSGSLAEDALARQALATKAGGKIERARKLARDYQRRYPKGIHLKRLGALLR